MERNGNNVNNGTTEQKQMTLYDVENALEQMKDLEQLKEQNWGEIIKLENGNTVQEEQSSLLKDKIKILDDLLLEKQGLKNDLEIKYQGKLSELQEKKNSNNFNDSDDSDESSGSEEFALKKKNKEDEENSKLQMKQQIIELLSEYLQQGVQQMSKHDIQKEGQGKQQLKQKIQQQQINNSQYITVRLFLPNIDFDNIKDPPVLNRTFRFNKESSFMQLKNYACKFWQIPLLLKREGGNQQMNMDSSGGNNEREDLLEDDDFIGGNNNNNQNQKQMRIDNNNDLQQKTRDDFQYMELCDETFSHIDCCQNMEEFLILKGFKDFQNSTLVLKEKDCQVKSIDGTQDASTIIREGSKGKEKANFSFSQPKHMAVDAYKEFFAQYPQLKGHINSNQNKLQYHQNIQGRMGGEDLKIVNDRYCCIVLFILVSLIVNLVFWTTSINTYEEYHIQESLKNKLELKQNQYFRKIVYGQAPVIIQEEDEQGGGGGQKQSTEHLKLPNLEFYLKEIFSKVVFNSNYDGKSEISSNYEIIGPIRLRQIRQEIQECKNYVVEEQKNSCFDRDKFEHYKEPIGNELDWMLWKSKEEANSSAEYKSKKTGFVYDSGGYFVDFGYDLEREMFISQVEELYRNNWDNSEVRVMFLTLNLHSFTRDKWIYINMVLEKTVYDTLVANKPEIVIYQPNIYDGNDGETLKVLDIVRLVLNCVLGLFVIFQLGIFQLKFKLEYLFSSFGVFNVATVVFSFLSISQSFQHAKKYKNKTGKDIIDVDYFIDVRDQAEEYEMIFFYQILSIFFLSMRCISMLRISNHLKLLVDIITYAFREIISYLAIFLPLIVGFAFVFKHLWGPYIKEFMTYADALLQIIQMTLGNIKVIDVFKTRSDLSLVYIIIFYLVVVFMLYAFFIGQLIESYNEVVKVNGYPSQISSGFTFSYGIQWMFAWLPMCLIRKIQRIKDIIFKVEKKNEHEKQEDEDQDQEEEENQKLTHQQVEMSQQNIFSKKQLDQ